jgi:hypothetical protein
MRPDDNTTENGAEPPVEEQMRQSFGRVFSNENLRYGIKKLLAKEDLGRLAKLEGVMIFLWLMVVLTVLRQWRSFWTTVFDTIRRYFSEPEC